MSWLPRMRDRVSSGRSLRLSARSRAGGGSRTQRYGEEAADSQRALLTFALRRIFPYPNRLRLVFRLLRALRGSSLLKLAFREGVIRDISPRADFAASLLLSTAESDINHAPVPDQKEVEGPSVTVFTGCVMEGLYKGVNEATVARSCDQRKQACRDKGAGLLRRIACAFGRSRDCASACTGQH